MLEFIKLYDTEEEYRADSKSMNYSKLADFDKKTPRGWRKKYIDNVDEEEKVDELRQGSLLDLMTLGEEGEFEGKVHISSVDRKPTPGNLRFCEELLPLYLLHMGGESGFSEMSDVFEEAFNRSEIKSPKFPKFMENWDGSDTESYFLDMLSAQGKIVCSTDEFNNVDKTSNILKRHPNSAYIFEESKDGSYEGINQLKIGFEFFGEKYRAMLDRLCIDHKHRVLKPFDLKSAHTPPLFDRSYFDYRYYIQEGIYTKAVEAYRDEFYPDYSVAPFKFLVIDIMGLYDPLIWKFEFRDNKDGSSAGPWEGFKRWDRPKKGINQLMSELNWHIATGNWGTTQEIFNNRGKITFEI